MIVFDLACPAGHVFEAWFGSSTDYDDQQARGLVSCPLCGAGEVTKAVMAPFVGAKGNQQRSEPAVTTAPSPPTPPGPPPSPEQVKAMLATLAETQAKMLSGAAYVGKRFATEAREMHLGERDEAPIYGEVSIDEARALHDEGVPVAPLPFPVRAPGQDN
ncbi:DUF1178 family protein [Sphingomonas naphthae]|uniref:DUF1178 family protein n=1 Tax=Sphingomonas naphthae TaxID=1813468 RepID=A0ABY7TI71_9SPHN|nr:DUF1178 family protein [Sphingomonas naphthae]WCT72130.1 DUF1178 family protein [Sphingomonas naphthae]